MNPYFCNIFLAFNIYSKKGIRQAITTRIPSRERIIKKIIGRILNGNGISIAAKYARVPATMAA